jgi:hypothetical protein
MSEQEIVVEETVNAQVEPAENAGEISADVVNLSQTMANTVKAELVRISQGGAQKIIATEVELKQGGASHIEAQQVKLVQGGAGSIQAASVQVSEGGVGIVQAETVALTQTGVAVLYSQAVEAQADIQAGLLFARQASAKKIETKLLLAGNVEGQVETVMDTRQALLAGLGAGLMVGTLLLVGQLLAHRKS